MHRKWWTLIAVCTATFMLLMDITVVNVALPDIQRELHASFSELQWVVDAYSLMLAALLLTAGSLADLVGRRLVFATGLVIFTLASLLCGLSGTPVVLDLMRGVQGIGGAIMFATSLALLAQEFRGRERGTAFGAWGASIGAAIAIGPLVGGALTEGLGWEWIFFVNIPVGIACVTLTLLRVPETRDPGARGVDWLGVTTFSSALFLLVFALIRGNAEGWGSAVIVGMLAGAAVLLALFFLVEVRQERPMLDLSLFRKPTFAGASIVALALSASMFAMFLYITLYVQNILGFSPLEAGLRFLPITLVSFFVAPVAGRLSARWPVRAFLSTGLVFVGAGLLLMGGLSTSSRWTHLLAGFVLAGVGIGLINPPLAQTAVGVVPPERSGMGAGINTTFRQVGIATGIAGLGAIFQHHVQSKAIEKLGSAPIGNAKHLAELISGGEVPQAIASVPPGPGRGIVAQVARESFISGLNELFVIAGVIAFVGAVGALVLVRQRDFVVSAAAPEPAAAG
jgi:EmrB/QacA subfamily drug resistance transporter